MEWFLVGLDAVPIETETNSNSVALSPDPNSSGLDGAMFTCKATLADGSQFEETITLDVRGNLPNHFIHTRVIVHCHLSFYYNTVNLLTLYHLMVLLTSKSILSMTEKWSCIAIKGKVCMCVLCVCAMCVCAVCVCVCIYMYIRVMHMCVCVCKGG